MKKAILLVALAVMVLSITSCAIFRTSMTPGEVTTALPAMTNARYMTIEQADNAVQARRARVLARRQYAVPLGLTVQNELKRGAKGIDEWVAADGGNAYILLNYKWVNIGDDGSTQLHLEFDTLKME